MTIIVNKFYLIDSSSLDVLIGMKYLLCGCLVEIVDQDTDEKSDKNHEKQISDLSILSLDR